MQLIKLMLIITKQNVKILSQMLAIINLHPHMSIIFIILILNHTKEDHHRIPASKIKSKNKVFLKIKNHSKKQHLKFKDLLIRLKILHK